MAFDVKTKTEFTIDVDAQREQIGKETWEEMNMKRHDWLQAAVDADKTDSLVTAQDGIRLWADTAAANEFKQFLENLATEYNLSATVTLL